MSKKITVKDVSRGAESLARTIDRLENGEYVVRLEKKSRSEGGIQYEISRSQKVRTSGS